MTTRLLHNAAILLVFLTVLLSVCQAQCPDGQYKPLGKEWCCNSRCPPGTRIKQDCPRDSPDEVTCEPCDPGSPDEDSCRSGGSALMQQVSTPSAQAGNSTSSGPIGGEAEPAPKVPLWIILVAVFGSFGSMILLVLGPGLLILWMYRKRHPPQQNQNGTRPESGERQMFLYRSADGAVRINRPRAAQPAEVEIEMERLNTETETHTSAGEAAKDHRRLPDDGISTGADDSTSETLSHLSQESGEVQTSSDLDGTDPRRKLRRASPREANEVQVNEETTEYIVSNLGNRYLRLARCLPATSGNIFSVTDIAELRHIYTLHGPADAIRETIDVWQRKNGDQANLEGLLIGLYTCEMNGIVEHLCQLNNVRLPDWFS
ncbi:Hypp2127 [Branchiostoma lanceolatum]|uniref:Hypp2127 protein n=1 Tax=Branchiostoma lanceolatum TaxID=7740 RepID=A0A8J9ZRU2_BRALA|nr:Hypp2127 [Branchiostoma lanceolatum]